MEEINHDTIEVTKEIFSEGEDEEEESKPVNNKAGTKLHTIESKLKSIKYANENNRKSACIKFQVFF